VLAVDDVVEEVVPARTDAEDGESDSRPSQHVAVRQHAGGARRREHEQVLDPLLGAGRPYEVAQGRRQPWRRRGRLYNNRSARSLRRRSDLID
jgi:hypothetical protein